MNVSDCLDLLMSRLGNRTEATLRATCLLEMKLFQQTKLERGLTLPPLAASQALAGRGIRGEVAGRALALGNQRLFDELQLGSPLREQATAWEAEGRTLSWLIEQGQPARVLGLLAFGDSLKAGAAAAVAALRDQGIESHLISGDNAGSANAVGRALGIDQVHAQVLPADKAAHVAAL